MGDAEDRPRFAGRTEGLDGPVRAAEHAGDELADRQLLTVDEQLIRDLAVGDGHVRLLWSLRSGFRPRRAAPSPRGSAQPSPAGGRRRRRVRRPGYRWSAD